jgi:hypothetical protein
MTSNTGRILKDFIRFYRSSNSSLSPSASTATFGETLAAAGFYQRSLRGGKLGTGGLKRGRLVGILRTLV